MTRLDSRANRVVEWDMDNKTTNNREIQMNTELTAQSIEDMKHDGRWNGYGYMGEREQLIAVYGADVVAVADEYIVAIALQRGYAYDTLFDFLNSNIARWVAPYMVSNDITRGQRLEIAFADWEAFLDSDPNFAQELAANAVSK